MPGGVEAKLEKCSCGKEVEIKYMAGIEPRLAFICKITNSKPYPRYYIRCSCGESAEIHVTGLTAGQRDRQKNKHIREWNKRKNG